MNFIFGGVAQLGEHLPCKQGVRSSTLLISTIKSILLKSSIYLVASYMHFKQRNLFVDDVR